MASVTVFGTSRASVRPDRATLDLGVTHVAVTSSTAMDKIAEQTRLLAELLVSLGFEERSWSTQGVSLAEEWEWKNETNTRVGYRATSGVTVTIVDLGLVSALLRAAVDDAGAQVRDLQWHIAADNPAREALLGGAALDAKRRATAYVTALDLALGAVEEISEVAIGSTPSPRPAGAEMMLRSAKASDSSAGMAVNPGEIELTASVFVRFGTVPNR
ncbi:MAG: SIMPL domain-containing protein [Ilumatobacteraceae bacterium]